MADKPTPSERAMDCARYIYDEAQDMAAAAKVIDRALTAEREETQEWDAKIARSGSCCCDPSRSKFIKHFSNCAQYIAAAISAPRRDNQ